MWHKTLKHARHEASPTGAVVIGAFAVGEHLLLAYFVRWLIDFCKFYHRGFAFRNRVDIEFGVMPEELGKNLSRRGVWPEVRCIT
ncbi:hypothetical protein PCIT_a1654 [Pseudoalteromonas citrea]|uniref:Uncharacterized protein n=2 Tax=Pseudoalteromonas citrea TaxID=43655 RepID=A0AAD4AMY8_9GAMM|nr:hypothetical protein PCIT_a1654 [Pseudoalteromonas citrea]